MSRQNLFLLKINNAFIQHKDTALSFRMCHRLICSRSLHCYILKAVCTLKKLSFIWALLCIASFSRAVIYDQTTWWRSELRSKMESEIENDEMETDIGTWSLIQFLVSVCFHVFFLTRIYSNWKRAEFSNNLCIFSGTLNACILSKRVFLSS